MLILGIETSCDETALCLLEVKNDTYTVLGSLIHSQIPIHQEFGGVFPMVAKREHAENLVALLERLFKETKIETKTPTILKNNNDPKELLSPLLAQYESILLEKIANSSISKEFPNIDRIAVTQGPGLEPALWVGINFAKALNLLWNIPIVPVNHMEGHILGSLLPENQDGGLVLKPVKFPALSLLISGGHTELVLMEKFGSYQIIGKTRDDAVGEAFDKIARMLGLPYPGGPELSKLAEIARAENLPAILTLPRPMLHSPDFDFSFSGLKTSVLYGLKNLKENKEKVQTEITDDVRASIARETEDAIIEVIISKTKKAIDEYHSQTLIVGGGVSANSALRKALSGLADTYQIPLYLPTRHIAGDNALMIAIAGSFNPTTENPQDFKALGNLCLS